jgi:ATP-dependent DNA ligase
MGCTCRRPLSSPRERYLTSDAGTTCSQALPLVKRREKLRDVLIHIDVEGVVSKRRNSPYLSGTRSGWVKVKSATWHAANKNRWEMFRRKTTA